MVSKIERPLDLLNASKGKEVMLYLKDGKILAGTLLAFDIHINLVVDNTKEIVDGQIRKNLSLAFVRGNTILYITPGSTAKPERSA